MTGILKERSARSAMMILVAVFILLTAAGSLILWQNSREMTQAFIRQDIALVGGMSQGKPITQLSILTGSISRQDVDAGNKLLAPYSYDVDMPLAINAYYQHIFNRQLFFFWFTAVAFFALSLGFFLVFMARISGRLRHFGREVSTLCFLPISPAQEEGDFSALRSAVIALAKRSDFQKEALQKDKEYLKNLLSDISHQLKTPLAALRMYNEILIGKPGLNTEKREEFLQRSKNQIDRTDWLIQGLLKTARVEAGAVEMNRRELYLVDTVEQAIAPFSEAARLKGVGLTADVPAEIRFAHDGEWVAEAIGNIVKNALEHTPAGGKINMAAEETPLTVAVRITDNGEGMQPDEIPHVFERFYRKNAGANTGNVGIGLSLAKEILEKNGGEIFVKSTPGQGSEFTITFLKNYKLKKS